jgi:hypothetical protein
MTPVTITPEAARRTAALGLQGQLQSMIGYAQRNLPELDRIEVVLTEPSELEEAPLVAILAFGQRPYDPAEPIAWDLAGKMVREYPPEVLEHLHLSYYPGNGHAG